nr:DUF5316 family protein [Ornithinibacillus caprae]
MIIGFFTNNIELYRSIILGIGIVFVLISGLIGGIFTTSGHQQANYSEPEEDRRKRRNFFLITSTFAIPNLVIGFLLYLYQIQL